MDIARTAKKPDTAATGVSVLEECLDCKDCKGPCLLYQQLYNSLVLYGLRRGPTA